MVQHIATSYPEENATLMAAGGESTVRQLVRDTIASGKSHGIKTEQALAGLIDLTVVYGRDFEFSPGMEWAEEILNDDSLEGSTKIDMIFELLPED